MSKTFVLTSNNLIYASENVLKQICYVTQVHSANSHLNVDVQSWYILTPGTRFKLMKDNIKNISQLRFTRP